MIKNRKKVEDKILKIVKASSGSDNEKLYIDLFKSMNNKEFHKFMEDLRDKKITISVIIPNGGSFSIDTEKNLKLCKNLGYEPFQRTTIKIPNTNISTLSTVKSLILYTPVKRLAQHMVKKISYAEHLKSRNFLTGQVANASKSAKITSKELNIFLGKDYTSAMSELMMARSGDSQATNAMNALIDKYGEVSIEDIKKYAGGSRSTKTMHAYFKAMHLDLKL